MLWENDFEPSNVAANQDLLSTVSIIARISWFCSYIRAREKCKTQPINEAVLVPSLQCKPRPFGEAAKVSLFVPPTPQFPREKKRRALGRRAWRGRQGSTALRLSPIGDPTTLAPSPRLSSARWGGSVTCKTPSFNEVAWGLFLQCKTRPFGEAAQVLFSRCKTQSSRRGTQVPFSSVQNSTLRWGSQSPPCIAPRTK